MIDEQAWLLVRGIPLCPLCIYHLKIRPDRRKVYDIFGDHTDAQVYFAFIHLSHMLAVEKM